MKLSSGQFFRIAIGVGLLVLVGFIYLPHLFFTYSTNAVVSARVLTLTSPIDGTLTTAPQLIGTELEEGDVIAVVDNVNLDKAHLQELNTEYKALSERLQGLEKAKEDLDKLRDDLLESYNQYKESTLERIDLTIEQEEKRKAALQESLKETSKQLGRQEELLKKGNTPFATRDRAYYSRERALKTVEQAQATIDRLDAERSAVEEGVFINPDGRSEVPYQLQRIDEVAIRESDINAQIQEFNAKLDNIDARIEEEEERVDRLSKYVMLANGYSVIWRTMANEGTSIDAKTPIVELLDCSNVFVDMTIHERYFDKIKVGDKVTIRLTGSNEYLNGIVSSVRGGALVPSAATAMAAFAPIRRQHEIQVFIKVDESEISRTKGEFCQVGRTGEVMFNDFKPAF